MFTRVFVPIKRRLKKNCKKLESEINGGNSIDKLLLTKLNKRLASVYSENNRNVERSARQRKFYSTSEKIISKLEGKFHKN